MRLSVLRHKLRRFHIVWFPIKIENLILRPQKIRRISVALEAPRHAMGLRQVYRRHMIDRAVTTETANAAVHVRRVIVVNVIDSAIDPHPLDRVLRFPALPHRFQLRIIFLYLRVAIHAGLSVRHIGMRRHFDKAVTIAAIHSQLGHMDVVWKRDWLDWFVTNFRVLRRPIIPGRRRQTTDHNDGTEEQFKRYPVGPAWKEVGHGKSGKRGAAGQNPPARRIRVEIERR